jgi:predicted HTH transcriptional regulator
MTNYIKQLIEEGENQHVDFKFEIADSRKIARTLVAFANTDGGRLLVGVKDNGAVSGVRSDEEFFMVDGAAKMYCRPEVPFEVREWNVEGKRVLEIIIRKSNTGPYYALDKGDKWMVYIRQGDQNFLANAVLLRVWKKKKSGRNVTVRFTDKEKFLLQYLEDHKSITLSKFQRMAKVSRPRAEAILVDFILLGIVEIVFSERNTSYNISSTYKDNLPPLDWS